MDHRQNGSHSQHQPQADQRQHQRFSWQQPQVEAPAYAAIQYPQPHPQTPQHAPQQPQVSTTLEQNRHFSYAQTPVEHEAFFYVSSPSDPTVPALPQAPQARQNSVRQMHSPYTPIDERPQSIFYHHTPLTSAVQPQPQSQPAYAAPSSYPCDEKHPVSPVCPQNDHPHRPFSPVSPIPSPQAFAQPAQRPTVAVPKDSHARKISMASLSPINTNVGRAQYPTMPPIPPTPPSGNPASPLSHKTPVTPISAGSTAKGTLPRENRKSYANEPYSPHGFNSTQTNNLHAVFSPDAAHGPNGLDFALHQPGQIAHPNMESESSKEWSNGLFSCAPECLTGLFCPCILYGRTAYRLSQKSAKKDPTDMLGHSTTNGHCLLMSAACGLWWMFPMLQRTRIRHAYKLGGSMASDLLKGCCCCCCVAVQNEREVKSKEEASRRWAGPANTDVYGREGGMMYKPQR